MCGKRDRVKRDLLMLYPIFLEIWNVVGRVSIILSCLSVLTAFVEADMWHFTEPKTLGFSVWASIVFVASINLPQFTMLFRTVRVLRISNLSKFILTILPSLLLSIVSLPVMAENPEARTILLSIGVFLIPYIFYWVLYQSTFPKECHAKPCFPSSFLFNGERKSLYNEDHHLVIEILMAVLFSMSCRWVTISINLFYEAYEPTHLLFATVLIYSTWQLLRNLAICRKGSQSPNETGLVIIETDINISHNEAVLPNENDKQRQSMGVVNEAFAMGDMKGSKSDLNQSTISNDSILQSQSEMPALEEKVTLTPFRIAVLWATGIFLGLEIGSITSSFLWIFSSPNILCLWSDKDPKLYGSPILMLFLASVISIIIDPRIFLKCFENTKVDWLPQVIKIITVIIICGFLTMAMTFFCFEELEENKYVGSCILTIFLPIVLFILADDFRIILQITSLPFKGCNSTFFLPGLVGLIATLTFCSIHVLSIFFVIPFSTRALLGQLKIVGSTQLILLLLVLLLHLVFNSIEYLPKKKPSPLNCLTILNRKKIIYISITSLFVVTSLGIGPTYLIQGLDRYDQAIENIKVKSLGYQDTIKVLSWNILLIHDYWGKDSSSSIAKVVEAIEPDIVGFQEADPSPLYWGGKDGLSYFTTFLKDKYKAVNGVGPSKPTFGISLLTKFDVLDHNAELLPTDVNVNVPNYAVMHASLDTSSKSKHGHSNFTKMKIHVFNLHSVYKGWTDPPLTNLSRRQIEFVVDKIRLLPEHVPLIVMGDFNLTPEESELDPLYDQTLGLKIVLHSNRNESRISTLVGNNEGSVDHIFYRGLKLVSSQVIMDVDNLSDHRPVFSEFYI